MHTPVDEIVKEMVARARAGDERAWRWLVDHYQPVLLRVAQRCGLGHDDALDVAQTTWAICFEKITQLTEDSALLGWLVTIARRESYRVATQVRRCEPRDLEACTGSTLFATPADVAAEVSRRDELARLNSAIDDLPVRQQTVLRALAESEAVDYATAARRLGVPVGSLGPTRARAVRRLRADPRLALAG